MRSLDIWAEVTLNHSTLSKAGSAFQFIRVVSFGILAVESFQDRNFTSLTLFYLDHLVLKIWEVGSGPDGTTELTYVLNDLTTGETVIDRAAAYVKKK